MHDAVSTVAPGAPLSEFEAVPARVVVHDPSATEAFARLAGVGDEELKDRTLFSARPDRDRFGSQHAALVRAVQDAGVEVVPLADLIGASELWSEVEANPNLVYTRDAAITLPWLPGAYVGGAMRMPIRRPEMPVMAAALEALGLHELFTVPPDCFLEGGDVIPLARDGRRVLLVGFGPRTARRSLDLLYERLAPWALDSIVGVELDESRMNLDGVLVPVADDVVVAHRASVRRAFVRDSSGERDVDVLHLLQELGMAAVEVTREESTALQACNCLALGDRRVVSYDLATRVVDELRRRELEVTVIPGSELIKGTGGPRCMTRPVYG